MKHEVTDLDSSHQAYSHNCNRLHHYGETKLREGLQPMPVKLGN